METIVAALGAAALSAAAAIIVGVIQHRKSQALIEYKLDELTRRVEKHNNLIERVYELEKNYGIMQTEIKVANHRIDDLEKAKG